MSIYSHNITENSLELVRNDSMALQYVKNQTDKICVEAVKNNGWALQFVKNQTDEICIEAIKNDGRVLQYVKNQTDEICVEAVKNNGWALKYVILQTYDICMIAINNKHICDERMKKLSKGDIMDFIIDQEMKEYCSKYSGDNIRFANTKRAHVFY